MRIAFTTLGCKINQFETDVLRHDFQSRGGTIVPFDAEADVYVINTCTVTAKSDAQCRQTIRAATLRNSKAQVVVTGCYAETRPDEIRRIPGVALVCGNRDKEQIADRVLLLASPTAARQMPEHDAVAVPARAVQSRTRGFLKIQDGCNNRCSYCIVPDARGGSRSSPVQEVTKEFERLVQSGCPEIVLTGIHIGTYGTDLPERTTLTQLVGDLLLLRGTARLRVSSIEPREVTDELTRSLGKGLCRHLHIPLQSGDDSILSAMKRNYTAAIYRDLLDRIANQVPGIALGTDVIVGFPGEGEQEFRNTLLLVERLPLTHLHVFSYSPRPGTPAAEMKGQVSAKIKKERNEAVRELGIKKIRDFRVTCLGQNFSVVVEDKIDAESGMFTGLTDNYIRVRISGAQKGHIGKKLDIRIEDDKYACALATII